MEVNGIQQGQRVRVTTLQTARGWRDSTLVTIAAGASHEGVVRDLTADGFFELDLNDGHTLSFSVNDTSITVEQI